MKNKYPLLIWVLLILSLASIINVFAHPGRTDQNGGHWDRESGTYHFHTGEYAGKGGGGSSNSEYVPFKPPYDPPTDNPYRKNKVNLAENASKKLSTSEIILGIISFPFVFCLIYSLLEFLFVELIYHSFLERHLPRYKINLLQEKIDTFNRSQNEILELNTKIFDLNMKYQIPDLYEIGIDNLPKDKNSSLHWGKSFTLYKTKSGTKLHTKYNCCSATNPLHIYNCRNYRNFSKILCKKCAKSYTAPGLTWYENYLAYKRAVVKQQSIGNCRDNLQKEIKTLHKKCNSTKTKVLIIFSRSNKKALQEANRKYRETQKAIQLSLFDYAENEVLK